MRESKLRDIDAINNSLPGKGRAVGVTRVISFTSGKGGVGKTNSVINLGIALSRLGRRVLLLDADLSLANLDILLGLVPRHTLEHVLCGEKTIAEVMLDGPEGMSIIPAASGVSSLCELSASSRVVLLQAIEEIAADYDYLLIDTAAGIDNEVMYFNSAAGEINLVINAEPTSLTDAYAMIKVLTNDYGEKDFGILVNNVQNEQEALFAFRHLDKAVDKFLKVRLSYLGFVPTDSQVSEAIRKQRAVSEIFPSSPASLAYMRVAKKIEGEIPRQVVKGGMQFFFRQLLEATSI